MKNLRGLGLRLASLVVAYGIAMIFVKLVGESPVKVTHVLFKSAFGTWEDFGWTLSYATPLLFTGLSVAVALRAGLFNIGGEGQIQVAACAGLLAASVFSAGGFGSGLAIWISTLAAAGALGYFAGWLKARRGSHEVITTIMLNYSAAALLSYAVVHVWRNPLSQNPESVDFPTAAVTKGFGWFGESPVGWATLAGLILVLALEWALKRTRWGYEFDVVGQNPRAAAVAGIQVEKVWPRAMAIAAMIASGVVFQEVYGSAHRVKLGFTMDAGFVGIAVGLLAGGRPFGVAVSALLFGALHKGATDLDMETEKITREFSLILQALIIVGVSATGLWEQWILRRQERRASRGLS